MNQEIKYVKFEKLSSNSGIFPDVEIANFIIDQSRKLEINHFPNNKTYDIVFIKDNHRCHLSELSDQFGWDWFGSSIKEICEAEDHWIRLCPLKAQQVNDVMDLCLERMKQENSNNQIVFDLTDKEIQSINNIGSNKKNKKAYQKLLGV